MNRAIKITMINYKGGVGKTTSVYNFSSGLNFLCDKRVLMIDMDPQCSLTNICLKAYSRKISKEFKIENLTIKQTVNDIFKQYLRKTSLSIEPEINLNELILQNFYSEHYNGLDLIPATMFDYENSNYPKGLDDLEIEIARQHLGENTILNHITILAKFFMSSGIESEYDFIIFDCPPANSLITQNALVVSDYYLIPSIMDDMSSYGIPHMHNLIQNTIFNQFRQLYANMLNSAPAGTYLDYLKKEPPYLLGIFETLRKTGVDTSSARNLIARNFNLLYNTVIFNHVDTARTTSDGLSCFSVNIKKNDYSPHVCYGKLVAEGLKCMSYPFDEQLLTQRINEHY